MHSDWMDTLFANPEMMKMGHRQTLEDRNLGLGWLYYALIRIIRPSTVVCIGSWRGFAPITLGHGIKDNNAGGQVVFIDPSLADDQWADPDRTRAWFADFGLDNINHHCMTTQEFVDSEEYNALNEVDLLFVDGYHSAEQARFDHETFEHLLSEDAMILFHDSVRKTISRIYNRDDPYEHTVMEYMNQLKQQENLQVIDFFQGAGVTLVRKVKSSI